MERSGCLFVLVVAGVLGYGGGSPSCFTPTNPAGGFSSTMGCVDPMGVANLTITGGVAGEYTPGTPLTLTAFLSENAKGVLISVATVANPDVPIAGISSSTGTKLVGGNCATHASRTTVASFTANFVGEVSEDIIISAIVVKSRTSSDCEMFAVSHTLVFVAPAGTTTDGTTTDGTTTDGTTTDGTTTDGTTTDGTTTDGTTTDGTTTDGTTTGSSSTGGGICAPTGGDSTDCTGAAQGCCIAFPSSGPGSASCVVDEATCNSTGTWRPDLATACPTGSAITQCDVDECCIEGACGACPTSSTTGGSTTSTGTTTGATTGTTSTGSTSTTSTGTTTGGSGSGTTGGTTTATSTAAPVYVSVALMAVGAVVAFL